eukprot:1868411-Rhodomonas_salina.2
MSFSRRSQKPPALSQTFALTTPALTTPALTTPALTTPALTTAPAAGSESPTEIRAAGVRCARSPGAPALDRGPSQALSFALCPTSPT